MIRRFVILMIMAAFSVAAVTALADDGEIPGNDTVPPHWILETYAKKTTEQTGIEIAPKDVQSEESDLNGDGHPDWLVYSSVYCGSAGCGADVYAFIKDRYCYVGHTRYGDAPDALRNKYPTLKCETEEVELQDPGKSAASPDT